MSRRMRILNTLKKQKVGAPTLGCNPGAKCWCAQISFVFGEPQETDTCLSPREILESVADELTVRDRLYLESLLDREFIK